MKQSDSDLLQALHAGIFEEPLLQGFLAMLRERTGAFATTLIVRTIDREMVFYQSQSGGSPSHLHQLYLDEYAWDPLAYRHVQEGRVYRLPELIDPDDPVHRGMLKDLMAPQGLTDFCSVRVAEPSGAEAWLGCVGCGLMEAEAHALLDLTVPHLRIAMQTFIALERERLRTRVTSEAIGRLSFGWMLLDAHCRIMDCTPDIDSLMSRTGAMRRGPENRLVPASAAIGRDLAALVHAFATGAENRPRVLTLSRDPLVDMLVTTAPERAIVGTRPVALAYVRGDHWSQGRRYDQLGDLFGLTPSEARLAWAFAAGRSMNEAATELGISIETARTYSKRVFHKTGARGQADLVRIILTSLLAVM